MIRALELAARGHGQVAPNPMVGCVLVAADKIIGEGWHQQYGAPHAEVNAIRSVNDPQLLKQATAYVTLEPCAHYGKTPPCADLLIEKQIPRVVIGMRDPFAQVDGRGIERLREAGVEVIVGVKEATCRQLNARFLCFHTQKRPYIILKWAETADGFLARSDFSSKWISDAYSRMLVHKWRSEEAAIMVGTNTLRYDNPSLTVRDWTGKHPLRITIDKNLRYYPDRKLFDQQVSTLCYNLRRNEPISQNLELVQLSADNLLPELLTDLHRRGVQSLLVEGGAGLLGSFLEAGLWDEIRRFRSPVRFGGEGIPAPVPKVDNGQHIRLRDDYLCLYKRL